MTGQSVYIFVNRIYGILQHLSLSSSLCVVLSNDLYTVSNNVFPISLCLYLSVEFLYLLFYICINLVHYLSFHLSQEGVYKSHLSSEDSVAPCFSLVLLWVKL